MYLVMISRMHDLSMQIQFRPQSHKVKFLSFLMNFWAPRAPLLLLQLAIESNVSKALNNGMHWHASKLAVKLRSPLQLYSIISR